MLKLDIGKESFPIQFSNGEKAEIYFNPDDPGLAIRLKNFKNIVPEKIAAIKDVEITNNGTPSIEQGVEVIERFEKIEKIIFDELDKAFGGDISAVVFKYCSPFALVKGDFYIIRFLEAMIAEIQKRESKSVTKREEIYNKYLSKYGKK